MAYNKKKILENFIEHWISIAALAFLNSKKKNFVTKTRPKNKQTNKKVIIKIICI